MATSRVYRKPKEPIELPMHPGERFTIVSEEGDWWFIARNKHGAKGYIPAACVKLDGRDPSVALYKRWMMGIDDLMKRGDITLADWSILAVPEKVIRCNELSCRAWKQDKNIADDEAVRLGACIHDVESLLKAEPEYSADWLKTERIRWHPDRFRPKCTEDARALLGKKAEHMFTVLTRLYEAQLLKEEARPRAQAPRTQTHREDHKPKSHSAPRATPAAAYSPVPPPTSSRPRSESTTAPKLPVEQCHPNQGNGTSAQRTIIPRIPQRSPLSSAPSVPSNTTRSGGREPRSLDPSAAPFRPQSTPAAWTEFAKQANVRKHDQELTEDPIGTFDRWNRRSTSETKSKAEAETRRHATLSTQDDKRHQRCPEPRVAVYTPASASFAWQETEDQRHQRLLVQARIIRAKAIRKLAERQQYHQNEDQRHAKEEEEQELEAIRQETRRANRARWGKQPLNLDERVAEQDVRERRIATKEKMRAAAEVRVKARLEAQRKKVEDWRDEGAGPSSDWRWDNHLDAGMEGGYGDCESGPATP